jgi:arginine decarboxylase
MKIQVVSSTGTGKTLLSSFDKALHNAGVLNYNLITLSSVIPPNCQIEIIDAYHTPEEEWGHKLYVVKAEERSDQPGQSIACGVGWYMYEGEKGVFVEHELVGKAGQTAAEVEADVKELIVNSLSDLCLHRGQPFDPAKVGTHLSSATAGEEPTTVLTLAIYQSQGWN